MIKAKIRDDGDGSVPYCSDGQQVPHKYLKYIFKVYQPDELDGEQFNAFIVAPDGRAFLIPSIDLDFI